MKKFFFLSLSILLFATCKPDDPIEEVYVPMPISYEKPYVNALLGNPSKAETKFKMPDNYLVVRDQFILGYKNAWGEALWLSWHMSEDWYGSTPRQDDFRPDNLLPTQYTRITNNDYTGSGFDRGHICPSSDRTKTVADNSATFNMTNMLPMGNTVNQNIWSDMEGFTRDQIYSGMEAYIVSGGYGQGGKSGNGGTAMTIAAGKVRVPAFLWRVMVFLPVGSNDLDRITASTRVVALAIPNDVEVGTNNWGNYRVSVDALEAATGLDLLDNLPDAIENQLESQVDNGPI